MIALEVMEDRSVVVGVVGAFSAFSATRGNLTYGFGEL